MSDTSADVLPHGPAGTQAAWVLERMGRVVSRAEIEERFAPGFLHAVPPEDVEAVLHSFEGLIPLVVREHAGDDVELRIALDGATGPLSMSIAVEPEAPHRITGLLIRPAGPGVAETVRGASGSADVAALLDEHVAPYAAGLNGERVGLVVGVGFRGERRVAAYGAVDESSIFEIGSVTKPVTATLLAGMASAGEVSLDDPVERFLPDVSWPGSSVTLGELGAHTSGLPRLPVNLDVPDEADPYATFTIEALFEGLAATSIRSRGTVRYSNLGYSLLGQVLARAAGTTYEALVTERVLEPLGMIDAWVGPDPALDHRRVPGHARGDVVPHWTGAAVAPAGNGVAAGVADVLAFVEAHAAVSEGSALAMTHARRVRLRDGTHQGLAWVIVETDRGDVLWHNGGTGGFRSFTGFHPASGTAVVALANTSDGDGPDAAAAAVLGALIRAG